MATWADAELRELCDYLAQDYLAVRVLPDGSVAALHDLFYTRAILLGCDRCGWSRSFCFADRALASRRFEELQSEDDEPQGFVARRPELRDADGSYVGAVRR